MNCMFLYCCRVLCFVCQQLTSPPVFGSYQAGIACFVMQYHAWRCIKYCQVSGQLKLALSLHIGNRSIAAFGGFSFLVIQFSYWWIHKLRAIHCYYLWIHTIYEDYKQIFLVLKLMMYYSTVLRPSSSLSTFNFFFFFTLVFTQILNQGLPNVTWSRTYSSAQSGDSYLI